MKISAEVEELIKNNRRLESENRAIVESRMSQGISHSNVSLDLVSFGRELIEAMFDYCFDRGIMTEEDANILRNKSDSVNLVIN